MFFIIWSRWGLLIPLFIVIGFLAGGFAAFELHVPNRFAIPVALVVMGVVAGAGLHFADLWIQDRSGYVYYDPETDQPRVIEESSGHFFFLPMKFARFAVPILALCGAVVTVFTGV